MKRNTILKSLLLCCVVLFSVNGYSQNFEKKLKEQKNSIEKAYKQKKLTDKEYQKLLEEQDIIERTIEKANFDGVMDSKEKNAIHSKQLRAERRLKRYMNNREVY